MTTATKSANVSIKPIEVPKALQEGEKFIKWDEVCNIFVLVYQHEAEYFLIKQKLKKK